MKKFVERVTEDKRTQEKNWPNFVSEWDLEKNPNQTNLGFGGFARQSLPVISILTLPLHFLLHFPLLFYPSFFTFTPLRALT